MPYTLGDLRKWVRDWESLPDTAEVLILYPTLFCCEIHDIPRGPGEEIEHSPAECEKFTLANICVTGYNGNELFDFESPPGPGEAMDPGDVVQVELVVNFESVHDALVNCSVTLTEEP